ncbi:MAG: hypothetical protein AAB368_08245, partial [bacterium]
MKALFLAVGACAAILGMTTGARADDALGLAAYLDQVRAGNPGLQASAQVVRGLELKPRELDMVYSPFFTANYGWSDDRKQPLSPLSPDRTVGYNWGLGLSKRFLTGTSASVNYGISYARLSLAPLAIPGLPPSIMSGFLPASPFFDARPSVTVSQSLLREFMSGLTDSVAQEAKLKASAAALAERYRARAALMTGEQAYWTLSLARSTVASKRASYERTAKLVEWMQRRVALNLADDADLLQVQAALKL